MTRIRLTDEQMKARRDAALNYREGSRNHQTVTPLLEVIQQLLEERDDLQKKVSHLTKEVADLDMKLAREERSADLYRSMQARMVTAEEQAVQAIKKYSKLQGELNEAQEKIRQFSELALPAAEPAAEPEPAAAEPAAPGKPLVNDKGGKLPYGYRRSGQAIEVHKQEAETVRHIFRLKDQGKKDRDIARTLTSEGRPTPRGGKTWSHQTVQIILDNTKAYCGKDRYPQLVDLHNPYTAPKWLQEIRDLDLDLLK